jgi:hypothetical protein
MANEIELREMVADDTLAGGERKDAAVLLVGLLVSEVPQPADDDPEVIRRMQPWPRNSESERWLADSFSAATRGRSVHGYSLNDAKLAAHEAIVKVQLKRLTKNTGEHQFIRDAAAARMREPSRVVW